ncbi:MAG: polysaccharide pyruvyl transferase family protein, partial [Deltaproteobacteria bacterium]|nr:polysaccharide pyruvyl transferase family protein [Deltaproteobacteria bacterium]
GLFGWFGSGNSGNEGSLEAMLIFLRRVQPDAELMCICSDPNMVQKDHGVLAIGFRYSGSGDFVGHLDRLFFKVSPRLANWVYAVRWMRRLDFVIIPGTGILDDFGSGPWFFPYLLFRWCLSARLCGTEVWFVSIGAGPIHHPMSRRLMKWAAAMAQYRSYRDTISKEFLESIGLKVRSDPIYPDLAFKLPGPQPSTCRRPEKALTVGVGVMNYRGWFDNRSDVLDTYLKKVTRFVIWLLDRGYRVRILTGDRSDRPAVDDLTKALAATGRTIAPERLVTEPTPTLHELMQQIALTDIVVATRFHNVVCALKLGKPAISIGYADKNDALLAHVGLAKFCQYIEGLDVDLLMQQFLELVADLPRHEQRIKETVDRYQQQLADQDAILESRLLHRRSRK